MRSPSTKKVTRNSVEKSNSVRFVIQWKERKSHKASCKAGGRENDGAMTDYLEVGVLQASDKDREIGMGEE
jgi:hypothetical protein